MEQRAMKTTGIILFMVIFFLVTISFHGSAQRIMEGTGEGNVVEMGDGAFTAGRDGYTSNYGLGSHPRGKRLVGLRITWVKPVVTRIQMRYQGRSGAVIYDGPVRQGQFISLPTPNLTVTGWVNSGGNHYNAVRYVKCWR
jgi:hypothetical protein